jgi:hypothetical protein
LAPIGAYLPTQTKMGKWPKIIRELIPIALAGFGLIFSIMVIMSDMNSQDKAQLAGASFSVAISGASGLSKGATDD